MRIVFFDIGHTLIEDPFPNTIKKIIEKKSRIIKNVLKEKKHQKLFFRYWNEENYQHHIQFGSHFIQEEFWPTQALLRLNKKLNIPNVTEIPFLVPELLKIYRNIAKYQIKEQRQIKLYKKILRYLRDLGVKIAAASDDREIASRSMLSWAKISEYFDAILTSESLSKKYHQTEKPNLEFYNALISEFKLKTKKDSKIIYVGDSEKNDIVPAKQIGMITVRYLKKNDPKAIWLDKRVETVADFKYSKIDELLNIFKNIFAQ